MNRIEEKLNQLKEKNQKAVFVLKTRFMNIKG